MTAICCPVGCHECSRKFTLILNKLEVIFHHAWHCAGFDSSLGHACTRPHRGARGQDDRGDSNHLAGHCAGLGSSLGHAYTRPYRGSRSSGCFRGIQVVMLRTVQDLAALWGMHTQGHTEALGVHDDGQHSDASGSDEDAELELQRSMSRQLATEDRTGTLKERLRLRWLWLAFWAGTFLRERFGDARCSLSNCGNTRAA